MKNTNDMKTQTKHTKGKWIVQNYENGAKSIITDLEDHADIATLHFQGQDKKEIAANAKRICHCVNNFDEVVEALKGIFELIENGTLVRDISKDDDMAYFIKQGSEINNKLFAAQQAIKKAE